MTMIPNNARHAKTAAIALVLVAIALAGCTEMGGDGSGAMYSSYEEAKAADGIVLQPNGTQSDVRIKLLDPASTEGLPQDEIDIVVLVYDSAADEPITDADFSAEAECNDSSSARNDAFCAWMPAMGHGTSPEENPTHVSHGEYHGMTTFSMSSDWQLAFNPAIDGEVIPFDIMVTVSG